MPRNVRSGSLPTEFRIFQIVTKKRGNCWAKEAIIKTEPLEDQPLQKHLIIIIIIIIVTHSSPLSIPNCVKLEALWQFEHF